jgi:RNA polymerase sigma factor (sigma-70 family)
MPNNDSHAHFDNHQRSFATTQWSMVIRAGQSQDGDAQSALAKLCERYWLPIHAYIRRRVTNLEEARDLTQAFFAHLLDKNTIGQADPERGRFRSFLLTAIKHFLTNEHEHRQAQKRGGSLRRLSLDFETGESRLNLEPIHAETPERIFERQWVLTLLNSVMERLQSEFSQSGKSRQFELLQGAITAGEKLDYSSIGQELVLTEEAVRQMASRLRKRYRELLREEVANTVDDPNEIDAEIRGLFASLSS